MSEGEGGGDSDSAEGEDEEDADSGTPTSSVSNLDEWGWDPFVDNFLLETVREAPRRGPFVDFEWVSGYFLSTLEPSEGQIAAALERFAPAQLEERYTFLVDKEQRDQAMREHCIEHGITQEEAEEGMIATVTEADIADMLADDLFTGSMTPSEDHVAAVITVTFDNDIDDIAPVVDVVGEGYPVSRGAASADCCLPPRTATSSSGVSTAASSSTPRPGDCAVTSPAKEHTKKKSMASSLASTFQSPRPPARDRVFDAMRNLCMGRPSPGKNPVGNVGPPRVDSAELQQLTEEANSANSLPGALAATQPSSTTAAMASRCVDEDLENAEAAARKRFARSGDEALRRCLEELRWHGEALNRCSMGEDAAQVCSEAAERRKALLWSLSV